MFVFHLNIRRNNTHTAYIDLSGIFVVRASITRSKLIIIIVVVLEGASASFLGVYSCWEILVVLIVVLAVLFFTCSAFLRFSTLGVSIIYLFVFIPVFADGPETLSPLVVVLCAFELFLVVAWLLDFAATDAALKFVAATLRVVNPVLRAAYGIQVTRGTKRQGLSDSYALGPNAVGKLFAVLPLPRWKHCRAC